MKISFVLLSFFITFQSWSQVYKSRVNLFEITRRDNFEKTPEVIHEETLKYYETFVALDIDNSILYTNDAGKPEFTTLEIAQKVMQAANDNPVVSLYELSRYDNGGIGFCFGRAMFVNIYLMMGGINRAHIKKAFIVGSMANRAWGWHVTTIVESRDAEGKEIWLAIDPAIGQVMEVKAWYESWSKYSDDKKLRLYISEPGKFGVTSSRYDEDDMAHDFYNNYFKDMMKWFEDNADTVSKLLLPSEVVENPEPEILEIPETPVDP